MMLQKLCSIVALACFVLIVATPPLRAQVVVFYEDGFPTVDSAPLQLKVLRESLAGAHFASSTELPEALARSETRLLVMPFGSAFPEADWPVIFGFLSRGGGLLTLGGRPFTEPAYFEAGSWRRRGENYAFARQLFISDYQPTPGSSSLELATNRDAFAQDLPAFVWKRAFSTVARLSDEENSTRVGASGTPDSLLRTLVWGVQRNRKLSAPVIEIDHVRNNFAGGRWVMLNCELADASVADSHVHDLIRLLATRAEAGASQFTVIPNYPLFLPGETPEVDVDWNSSGAPPAKATLEIRVESEGRREAAQTEKLAAQQFPFHTHLQLVLPARLGFHTIIARLTCSGAVCGNYKTGYWVRDEAYLLAGPHLSVDHDFFQIDGLPLPVVGTTYMASDAQRLYFRYPNPYVWDQDMAQISGYGINMLRTGLWTDWDTVTAGTGIASERALRIAEAFLMTARRHGLPVQFNLFAFMPEVFGGVNPYLDPEGLRRQRAFVSSLVTRFKDVPFLVWDLINEPSFDNPKHFFRTMANGDPAESKAWNEWLMRRYGSREAIQSLWKIVIPAGPMAVPGEQDATAQDANNGGRPLSLYDFNLVAQESFLAWAQGMRTTIRATGSKQLITVGQDEGGGLSSPSPAFFKDAVDFTTMHSWWFNDDLLWDSLVARQSDMPMLVQETGVMTEVDANGRPRRNTAGDARLLERKIGIALGTGAGAIEWLWNVNALMRSQQEITIGAVRLDSTEKPEAGVLESYAKLVAAARDHFRNPVREEVVILTSQAMQFSAIGALATQAQKTAVRVMNYQCRTPARVVAENRIADIEGAKLVVLPSPQALSEATWRALMEYVDHGGNLLITGPAERDEHWQRTHRLNEMGIEAEAEPLTYRGALLDLGSQKVDLGFSDAMQRSSEALRLPGGGSYLEVRRGSGRIFLTACPVELADSPNAAAMVYQHVLSQISITPQVAVQDPAILVRPQVFDDSILYLLDSESSHDQVLDITDKLSGAKLHVSLPAQRTKLILVRRDNGEVIASYDGPEL